MNSLTLDLLLRLLFGCVILLAGRNLFWLVIGLIGFLVGAEWASVWLADRPAWLALVVAVAVGLVGALVAIIFERVAFALAGFFAAAYLTIEFAGDLGFASVHPAVPFAAGLAGAIVAVLVMDWAIIVLSALVGAAAIVSTLTLTAGARAAIFLVLVAIGVYVQYTSLSKRRRV